MDNCDVSVNTQVILCGGENRMQRDTAIVIQGKNPLAAFGRGQSGINGVGLNLHRFSPKASNVSKDVCTQVTKPFLKDFVQWQHKEMMSWLFSVHQK